MSTLTGNKCKGKKTEESREEPLNYGKNPEEVIVKSVIPKKRQELLKWNGWGYQDSKFIVKNGIVHFTGKRYPIGEMELPYFTEWVKETLDVDLYKVKPAQPLPTEDMYPVSNVTTEILDRIREMGISHSVEGLDRMIRAHGHTLHDIFTLREGSFERIPDIVVWPLCHEDVEKLVQLADRSNLVIIPFGGGTAVSGAVECPRVEPRTIVSLDTSQMNKILWVDRENLVACCQSGIVGQDLERELAKLGYTSGHEPDSYEFSSLGGWVATRASGMKKNVYGNIEDLVVSVRMVTCRGVLQKSCQVPRMSCGPDFNHIVLGSEGSLGVITDVTLKLRPLPPIRRYNSILFPTFSHGVRCMRDVARARCQPASIRLLDNEQFRFGQSLKPAGNWWSRHVTDRLQRAYVTQWRGYHVDHMCVMTLLYEGEEERTVGEQERRVEELAVGRWGGMVAGEVHGLRGYMLTFVIAYIRDLAMEYYVVAESFETSVPWDRAENLCRNVKHRVKEECKTRNCLSPFICCRVTQTYDAGCVIYFYFAFNYGNQRNPVQVYEEIEDVAREEILACGGSISHHHGVGKLRKRWYESTVSPVGLGLYHAAKRELDPNNVFATGNLTDAKPESTSVHSKL